MIGATIIAGALGGAGKILKAIGPLLFKAAPWILAAVIGAAAWHHLPRWGPAARINAITLEASAAKESARTWKQNAAGWKAARDQSEALRRRETQTAGNAVDQLLEQCRAEVAAARSSARVIERIVQRPPTYDENRCPVRSVVDLGSLREALTPDGSDSD